jgi:hypothetical protein
MESLVSIQTGDELSLLTKDQISEFCLKYFPKTFIFTSVLQKFSVTIKKKNLNCSHNFL